jgi:hypothetical protein
MGDATFARAHFNNIKEFAEDRFSACIREAVRTGDLVNTQIPGINLLWFTHHLAMALNLCHLSGEAAFDHEGSKEELAFQAANFLLRGIGMTDRAIARYVNPDSLAAFFAKVYD